jgi:amidase
MRRVRQLGRVAMLAVAAVAVGGAAPAPFDVVEASIGEIDAALADGRVTSRQLVEAYLARIAAYDQPGPRLNTIVTLNPAARAQADAMDRERKARGPRGPLHGVPVLVKDNYDTADMATSGGTLALATLQPAADAAQVAKLRAAGAIILGKTAMHELAAGMTTVSSLTGYSRNPYDPARSPGGSSGGTGAAVAASFAAAGMGSDTCGSIRIPSAYQALVGLRGTRGLSNGRGIMPLSTTQDIGGPLARSVADLAAMLDATVDDGVPGKGAGYGAALKPDGLKGARIGILRGMFGTAPEDKEGQAVVDAALAQMRAAGAAFEEVEIPGMDDLLKDSSLIVHEFKFDFAAYLAGEPHPPVTSLGEVYGRGLDHVELDERFRQRDAAAVRDEAGYRAALAKRKALHDLVVKVLAERRIDALLYPTTLRRPPLIGGDDSGFVANCQFSATTGLPAIAVPAGFSPRGLPVGIELLGGDWSEARLLGLAYGWEQAGHVRRAPFSTPKLVGGKAPGIERVAVKVGAGVVRVGYDPVTGVLDLDGAVRGIAAAEVIALTVQRAHDGGPGPVLAPIVMKGRTTGSVRLTLAAPEREDLAAGRLYVALYTRAQPLGAGRTAIRLAGR